MEAKRRALDEIAARQRAADERRQKDAERQRQAAMVSPLVSGGSVIASGRHGIAPLRSEISNAGRRSPHSRYSQPGPWGRAELAATEGMVAPPIGSPWRLMLRHLPEADFRLTPTGASHPSVGCFPSTRATSECAPRLVPYPSCGVALGLPVGPKVIPCHKAWHDESTFLHRPLSHRLQAWRRRHGRRLPRPPKQHSFHDRCFLAGRLWSVLGRRLRIEVHQG